MKLRTTIGAENQSGEQARLAGFGDTAFVLTQLLNPKPSVLVNNCLLRVRHDAPLFFRLANQLVHFIADGSCF